MKYFIILLLAVFISNETNAQKNDPLKNEQVIKIIDLKDFKEGQVDYFQGLTPKEIKSYRTIEDHLDNREKIIEFLRTEQGQQRLKIIAKVMNNGVTYARDTDDDNQLIKIIEFKEGPTYYNNIEYIKPFDLNKEIRRMTRIFERMRDFSNYFIEEQIIEVEEVVQNPSISKKTSDVPFALIQEVPVYPGCEQLEANVDRKKCMSDKISKFINENFDIAKAKETGKTGLQKIIVMFRINKNGKVDNIKIRASDPILSNEAKRVIKLLPDSKPGVQDGENVGVLYALPIIFEVAQ